MSLFPEFKVSNLDFLGSDHRAVNISLFRSSTSRGVDSRRNSKFLFDPTWMTSGEFKEVVWSSWFWPRVTIKGSFFSQLKGCSGKLLS